MPIVERLAVLFLERTPVRHRVLGLQARKPQRPRCVLASKQRVRPALPVRIPLVRYVEHRAYVRSQSVLGTGRPLEQGVRTFNRDVYRLGWVAPVERLELVLRVRVVLGRRQVRAFSLHYRSGPAGTLLLALAAAALTFFFWFRILLLSVCVFAVVLEVLV